MHEGKSNWWQKLETIYERRLFDLLREKEREKEGKMQVKGKRERKGEIEEQTETIQNLSVTNNRTFNIIPSLNKWTSSTVQLPLSIALPFIVCKRINWA